MREQGYTGLLTCLPKVEELMSNLRALALEVHRLDHWGSCTVKSSPA